MSDTNDDGRAAPPSGPRIPKDALRPPLPKRFYKEVATEPVAGGHRVLLDGRPVKTPKKRALELPAASLAEAVAAEWRAQGAEVDPAAMPLTRIANTAIDAVADAKAEVAADLVSFAGTDLVCYRAEAPAELARRQATAWDPVLAWAHEVLGVRMAVTEGVTHVAQPGEALDRVKSALDGAGAFELSALHMMTTLTGSALLALAHARGAISADEAWAAAHVDEDYQIELWGRDAEADERRERRRAEFDAASRLIALLR